MRLFAILTVAFLLRFYHLGGIPLSINWDEASNGYNAYSILKTGRDEYGNFLPLYNRSFDDYKPPLYMYLSVISVKYFGLSELGVRIPSAVLGTLMILAAYFFVFRLFSSRKIALITSFLLAISPWNTHFSRVGFESNIGLFMGLAAYTLFLYALPLKKEAKGRRNIVCFILSAILFGLSFYSYHSARIFIPTMFIAALVIFRKEFLSLGVKSIFFFVLIPIAVILPFFTTAPHEAISQRYEAVSLGAQKESTDNFIKFVQQDEYSLASRFIHLRQLLVLRSYAENYFSHFNPEFLFVSGDRNLRHHIEGSGMLPLFLLPLILIGIYKLIERHNKASILIISWLIAAPIAAAPADAAPHAVRSIFMSISLLIIASLALKLILDNVKIKNILIIFLLFSTIFYLFTYLHNYYFHYPHDKSEFWMYGFKEAVGQSMKLKEDYPAINVDSSMEQGYIFWLFYTKYDPLKYQKNPDKPNIYNFSFNDNKVNEGELFVSLADHSLPDLKLINTIYYPNQKEAIRIGRKKYSWEE